MESIQILAYAKINLALDVLRRRPDGYHEVRMIMQTVDLYDKLTLRPINKREVLVKSNLSYLPTKKGNLVYEAASLFYAKTQISPGVCIELDKRIPVAAGMAGGSTDAASTLVALNEMYGTGLSTEKLKELGVRLGADVPYCIQGGTQLSEGIGEVLTPLAAPPSCRVLIVKPPVSVSTKFVYENLKLGSDTVHPNIDLSLEALKENDYSKLVLGLGNLLETVTIPHYPEIAAIKESMLSLGADGALMSGSGPTVFGLFRNNEAAESAYYQFKGNGYTQTYLSSFHNDNIK